MNWTGLYILSWLAAFALAAMFTAVAIPLGRRLGLVDQPAAEAHKKHERPVSLLGGPAMLGAWLLVVGAGLATVYLTNATADDAWLGCEVRIHLYGIEHVLKKLGIVVVGASAFAILGFYDDRRALKPLTKLVWQSVICGVVAAAGIRITVFLENPLLTWSITTFWLLLVVNAINFFDNMDGMAAGAALVAAFLFFVIAALQQQYFIAVLAAVTGGVAAGFLVFNWPPARIFMGDSGSHFLGFVLAVTAALETFYSPGRNATPASLFIPILILALPIFDLFAVVWLRIRRGVPFYQADNMHISHRFQMMGLGKGAVATTVHLLGLTIGAGALPLLWLPLTQAFVVLLQAAAILALVSILHSTT